MRRPWMLAAVATLLDAIYHAPANIRVLGGSFDQSDRLADYIRDMVENHPDLLAKPPTREKVRLAGGSEIRMLAQSQRAVRGQHVQKIRCDEVDLFDSEVWRAVQFATRSIKGVRGSIEVLSTLHRSGGLMQKLVDEALAAASTPSASDAPKIALAGPANGYRLVRWCLWEVIQRCPEKRRCDQCMLAEDCNGIARQGRGYFSIDDAIAIKARSSRSAWEAEMLCRGAKRDWLVFGEFDPARHVADLPYVHDWPLYRAIDFGYRSPLVCLWIQLSPGGVVHVLDEYVRTQLPIARHAQEILKHGPGPVEATYVDPAGRQKESTSGAACTEMLASLGIPCQCRASSIADGIELVRTALAPADGKPTLVIHPRCTHLIESLNSYHYPPPESGGPSEQPVKDGPDHAIDALRYFFVNRLWPRCEVMRKRY